MNKVALVKTVQEQTVLMKEVLEKKALVTMVLVQVLLTVSLLNFRENTHTYVHIQQHCTVICFPAWAGPSPRPPL